MKQDESVALPTASLKSFLATLLTDTYEGRDVAIFNVSGAYLQANFSEGSNEERVLLKLTGELVNIMCQLNLEHLPDIFFEKVKKGIT